MIGTAAPSRCIPPSPEYANCCSESDSRTRSSTPAGAPPCSPEAGTYVVCSIAWGQPALRACGRLPHPLPRRVAPRGLRALGVPVPSWRRRRRGELCRLPVRRSTDRPARRSAARQPARSRIRERLRPRVPPASQYGNRSAAIASVSRASRDPWTGCPASSSQSLSRGGVLWPPTVDASTTNPSGLPAELRARNVAMIVEDTIARNRGRRRTGRAAPSMTACGSNRISVCSPRPAPATVTGMLAAWWTTSRSSSAGIRAGTPASISTSATPASLAPYNGASSTGGSTPVEAIPTLRTGRPSTYPASSFPAMGPIGSPPDRSRRMPPIGPTGRLAVRRHLREPHPCPAAHLVRL